MITELSRDQVRDFLPLCDHDCRGDLLRADQQQIVALGARVFASPAGLILARVPGHFQEARIAVFRVSPGFRNNGLGTALITALEERLESASCRGVRILFREAEGEASSAIRAILRKRAWSEPRLKDLIFRVDQRVIDADWMAMPTQPATYRIEPWTDLSEADRRHLQDDHGWYPDYLSPFIGLDDLEPLNSLVIKREDAVVGWIITRRIAPDTILYYRFFLHPAERVSGRGIALLAEAIRRQCATDVEHGIFSVDADNRAMLRFARRHLAAYCTAPVRREFECEKTLGGERGCLGLNSGTRDPVGNHSR